MFAEIFDTEWTEVMDNILRSHKELTEEFVIHHIFVAIKVNEELEKTLEKLFKETRTNDKGFLTGYAAFRKYLAMLATYPKAVGE